MQEKKEGAASVGAALEVINRRGSYQQPPATSPKKAEGKKRKSPCTPYREKGKGKETRRGSCGTVCRARARGMRTKLMAELDRDLDRLSAVYHPTPGDRCQWASIALRVGVENFHFAVEDKFREDAADGTNFFRPPAVFQAYLNRRFPKKGGAR